MLILEDSRQQEKKHEAKHEYFRSVGCHWNRTALYCGDYTLPADQSVCIDTKKDIQELIGDIQVKQMSKGNILNQIHYICEIGNIPTKVEDMLFHAICDDDDTRFAEKEISDICHSNGINGYIATCKIMKKEGKKNICVFETFSDCNSVSIKEKQILSEYSLHHSGEFHVASSKSTYEDEFQKFYVKRCGFFHRGLKRAQNSNVRLIVLVENKDNIKSIDDLFKWVNPRLKIWKNSAEIIGYLKNGKPRYKKIQSYPHAMTGEKLAKALLTMQLKYGVEFQFCRPEEAGKRILSILDVKPEE